MAGAATGLAVQAGRRGVRGAGKAARPAGGSEVQLDEAGASVFLTRAIHAVVQLQQSLSKQTLAVAASASTDYMVLVNALTAAPVTLELAAEDPLAAAKLRGLERMPQLVSAGGGVVSAEQAARLLGITRQAVDKRRAQNRLIGLTQGRRGYGYPRFQFVGGTTLRGLEEVLEVFGQGDDWSKLVFFVNPNDLLDGETPESALRANRLDAVLRAARCDGEQGAR
jgi:hypothetical protein